MKKISMVVTTLMLTGITFAQNSNVVSAALEFKNYSPALAQGNFDEAKKYILEAKKYIDPAMKDASTINDEKANYYNAIINYSLIELSGTGKYPELNIYQSDSVLNVIKTSAKKASEHRRWRGELKSFFERKSYQSMVMGENMFKAKNYQYAFLGFAGAYKICEIAGMTDDLENMKTNSIISARQYIDTLKDQNKYAEAMEFVTGALEMFPTSEEIAIDGVNVALLNNDLVKAEELFQIAAKSSPDNKILFTNMGSIFLTAADKGYKELAEMQATDTNFQQKSDDVSELYTKAEKYLVRALEIDSTYIDAAYNLGVLYLGQGEKLKTEASRLPFNDPRYEQMENKSKEMYEKAIHPLEIYIEQDPNNAGVLQVLFQVHRNAGNTEKALEYKKRAEAASAK